MIWRYGILMLFGTLPVLAYAQVTTIQRFIIAVGVFINNYVIPLIFAIAFLVFLVNAVRYFIIGGANEDGQEKAKRLALWGIIAFVLMVSVWGIVGLLVKGLGFERSRVVCPDYMYNSGSDCIDFIQAPF